MTLEQKFHREALSGCETLRRKHGYNPTYYLRMVAEQGAVGAAKHLLAAEGVQSGLFTLWECGRLEMSIEAMVINPEYAELFTPDEIRIARKRLADLRYTP